ncbi:quinone-dependent dihydroorotate dehydrogenase [Bacteroidota bacterium]
MYKRIIRPILFLFSPESIHKIIFNILKFISVIPLATGVLRLVLGSSKYNKETELFGIKFPNQLGLAAGLDKNATAFDILFNMGFGFIEIGTVTPEPQLGNPKPRSFRLKRDKALINRMGFNNKGLKETIKKLRKRRSRVIIGGNIGKNTLTTNENAVNDYVKCFDELFDYVDYFVVNVSCPNIKDLRKLQDNDSLKEILEQIQKKNNSKNKRKAVLIKISPDLDEKRLSEVIEIVRSTGIDGIIATNTTTGRDNLSYTDEEINDFGNGGLSGKPLKNRAIEVVKFLHKTSNGEIPIIGTGGIMNPEDANDMIEAGASLVQIYTGFIYEGPGLIRKIKKKINSK